MLKKISNITYINIGLSTLIVILSFYTISWHHQSHLLYKKAKKLQQKNEEIMAMHKQLLSEYSTQISGRIIKQKAFKKLHMKRPSKVRELIL